MTKRLSENEATNYEYCANCKGECCKKSGCDYLPTDFDSLKYDYLLKVLNEGNVSIVSSLTFSTVKGRIIPSPFLYIRARGVGKGIIDLFSLKTTCASLTEEGCTFSFENRPSGGINLIPMPNPDDCYPKEDISALIDTWEPHQNILRRLVKRFTGKSADTLIREDYYNFFKDVLNNNFNGVHPVEIMEVKTALPALAMAFPDEFKKALSDINNSKNFLAR